MFNNKQNKTKKQTAFTFVEVLVATMLTALVMTAFGSMMALSMRVAETNEMEQLAQLKAQQAIEFFRKERVVRGWNTFYASLANNTYCLNNFPESIGEITEGSCGNNFKQDLNFFYYKVEAVTSRVALSPGEQSVLVLVNIYRYTAGGSLVYRGTDPVFFTVEQVFKQY